MPDNKTYKLLKHIRIASLWHRWEVDWALHPDVNILLGENGSGKSTVLQLLAAAAVKDFLLNKKIEFERMEITDTTGYCIGFDGLLRPIMHISGAKGYGVSATEKITDLHADYINTLEYYPRASNGSDGTLAQSNLDKQLDAVTRQYLAYQSKQSSKVFAKKTTFEKAFERKAYLIQTLNELFKPSGKTVDENEAELEFMLPDGQRIQRNDLSSGEKQLLIVLLTVLCQDEKPATLLMDEPEVSLHLHWQYKLIEVIRNLNPNCQVILATHSPSIFNDGWRDKVFWTEDIIRQQAVLV